MCISGAGFRAVEEQDFMLGQVRHSLVDRGRGG
jgi:hypothetical protein